MSDGRIVTYSGVAIDPLNPDPDLLWIEDIAHALSNVCRFTGHVRSFYSVAQHCVLCSQIVPEQCALEALLHDASEAYLSDMARPLKRQPEFGDLYKAAEQRLERAVALRFMLTYPWPQAVKRADDVLLRTEQRDLMPDRLRWRGTNYLAETIEPWQPGEAEDRFLVRYRELGRC